MYVVGGGLFMPPFRQSNNLMNNIQKEALNLPNLPMMAKVTN